MELFILGWFLPVELVHSIVTKAAHPYNRPMTDLMHHLKLFFKSTKEGGEIPLLVICGPTASGKTALSLKIAEEFNAEIISADSAQVYRKLDIGSDKVSPAERQRVKHHLIDIRDPDQSFTMADFKREATHAIQEILAKGKVPLICGGTGLYISSVVDNYDLPVAPPDPKIRAELEAEFTKGGKERLYEILTQLDPVSASKIHPNNVRYVARALEIVLVTQKPKQVGKAKRLYNVFKMAIDWPREVLYERIDKRVNEQIEKGLLNELKTLLSEGYSERSQAFYKEYFPYLRGEKPLKECKEELKQNTRNFAKRQLTWFRKEEDIYWIPPEEFLELTKTK
ncbi:tRNA (adenosine(37)-N6)-dimethylallyltransferase MiaA [Candidatus Peregrinibacteria bacterium]|nr:MAG: tRNA (adenosine(37)-N6)-dimethylallyltransferase MiaA [Candidatus Peregrinibacteria bacterium]